MRDYDPEMLESVLHESSEEIADNRVSRIWNMITSSKFDAETGYYMLMERFFPVIMEDTLLIREDPFAVVNIPSTWEKSRVEDWRRKNPDFALKKIKRKRVLWMNSCTNDGFIWENNKHWWQENGTLPGIPWVPDYADGMPTGMGEDTLSDILAIAAADTEGLNQVRHGSKITTHMTDATLKYPQDTKKELNSGNGLIIHRQKAIQKLGGLGNAIRTERGVPNTTFLEYEDRKRNHLEQDSGVSQSQKGVSLERQSDKAKRTEIVQGMITQSSYIRSYASYKLRQTNMLLKLIPYIYTENAIIAINDDYGQNEISVEVNQKINNYKGQAEIISNDLSVSRYKAVPMITDDSPTAKQREMFEYQEFLQQYAGLLQAAPRMVAAIMSASENRFLKKAAVQIEQIAQAQEQQAGLIKQQEDQKEIAIEQGRRWVDMQKIIQPKKAINVKLGPEEVAQNPMASQALVDAAKQQ
jgi:hypothetical protein